MRQSSSGECSIRKFIVSLGKVFQYLTTFLLRKFVPMFSRNFPFCNFFYLLYIHEINPILIRDLKATSVITNIRQPKYQIYTLCNTLSHLICKQKYYHIV